MENNVLIFGVFGLFLPVRNLRNNRPEFTEKNVKLNTNLPFTVYSGHMQTKHLGQDMLIVYHHSGFSASS